MDGINDEVGVDDVEGDSQGTGNRISCIFPG